MNQKELTELIKTEAIDIGFDLFGVTEAVNLKNEAKFFKKWLKSGNEADMKWLKCNSEKRSNPQKILPGAASVICLALNYFQKRPLHEKGGKIAIYAVGRDYHKVLEKMLKRLDAYIKTLVPSAKTRYYTDTGPLFERAFACKAGLGFVGKNSCLITKEFGSFVFLAEIITDIKLTETPKSKWKTCCGTCHRCADSCPNKAIIAPGVIDSRRCISYQTIENKSDKIPHGMNLCGYIFGCDICQQVCPCNCRAQKTRHKDFLTHIAGFNIQKIPKTDKEFLEKFKGSPLMRAKRKRLLRNRWHIKHASVPG